MLELIPLAATALSLFGQATDSISKLSDAAAKLKDVASQQAILNLERQMLQLEKTLHAMERRAFEVEKERDKLSDELKELKEGKKDKIVWRESIPYLESDPTQPKCSRCFEVDTKPISLNPHRLVSFASDIVDGFPKITRKREVAEWMCPQCGNTFEKH